MKKKLMNNLFLKILSVVFAFLLWLVVVNINDPDTTRIISNIPIVIENEEKITEQGLGQVYYVNSPTNRMGSVMVKGARSIVDGLKASDITATVDFGDVSSVGAVTINYTLPEGVTLVTKRVETMRITTEALKADTFDVNITTKGSTAEGYLLGDSKVSPNRVRVTAPVSILDSIKKVQVEVDVDGMSTDIAAQAELHLYDGNGKEINYGNNSHITVSASTLAVNIAMLRTQRKTLNLEIAGEVQSGYRFLGMSCDVKNVAVKGTPENVLSFTSITVSASSGKLNLSGLTEKTDIVVDLNEYLPNGISLLSESDRYVTVTLDVEPLYERELSIPTNEITLKNVPENMEVTYHDAAVFAALKGLYNDVYTLTTESLNPTIDLSGLEAGEYQLTLQLSVPEKVEQIRSVGVGITLSEHIEEISQETEEAFQENIGMPEITQETESLIDVESSNNTSETEQTSAAQEIESTAS